MRINVARRARAVLESILHRKCRAGRRRFVAIRADDSHVCPGQRKAGFFVPGQRKPRGFEPLQVVTSLAAILVRRTCELTFVDVFVAILALRLRDLEYGVFVLQAFRQMTLVAGHRDVATLKWILGCGVILYRERGRPESVNGMTRGTLPAIGPRTELPLMRVLVAIHALCER
jgi:hypothetical protein